MPDIYVIGYCSLFTQTDDIAGTQIVR